MRSYIILSDDCFMAEGIRHLLLSQTDTNEKSITILNRNHYKQALVSKEPLTIIHYLPKNASLNGLMGRLIYLSSQQKVLRQLILCDDFYHILVCLTWHVADLKVLDSQVSVKQLKASIFDLIGKHSLKLRLECIPPYFGINPREREVLYLLSRGMTNNQVSEVMNISCKTVSSHKRNVQQALQLHSRTDYVRFLNLFREFL